jgi:hypothetical protein
VNRLRVGLALAGFVLAVLSVALDDVRLAWAAISVLLLSLIARLIARKRANSNSRHGEPM